MGLNSCGSVEPKGSGQSRRAVVSSSTKAQHGAESAGIKLELLSRKAVWSLSLVAAALVGFLLASRAVPTNSGVTSRGSLSPAARLRVAICVNGHLRTFVIPGLWLTWEKNLLRYDDESQDRHIFHAIYRGWGAHTKGALRLGELRHQITIQIPALIQPSHQSSLGRFISRCSGREIVMSLLPTGEW